VSPSTSDRVAGTILLLFAALWIVGVFWTIPEVADGARLGPRGFPLAMGVMLVALSAMLIAGSFAMAEPATGESKESSFNRAEFWALLSTFGFLGGYVVLMAWLGFLIATVVSTALFLIIALNKRSPVLIVGMSLGLAVGIWLILGKLMGVYLPHGAIIDWL
jgi:putative tricarboxylic transport membrane protein